MDTADIAARLARGAGHASVDSIVWAAALFLVTRLWVVVACNLPRTDVWLWPYSGRVAAARAEWTEAGTHLARLRATQVRVDDLEATRQDFLDRVTNIEKLRPELARQPGDAPAERQTGR